MVSLFDLCDSKKKGLISFPDFCKGIDQVIKLSDIVKEKLYGLMDKLGVGMVDFEGFKEVMRQTTATSEKVFVPDNFGWEQNMVEKIKEWICKGRLSVEEVFKSLDLDFDGKISK